MKTSIWADAKRWLLQYLQDQCDHPSASVCADVLEGAGIPAIIGIRIGKRTRVDRTPVAIIWCRLCGAWKKQVGVKTSLWQKPRARLYQVASPPPNVGLVGDTELYLPFPGLDKAQVRDMEVDGSRHPEDLGYGTAPDRDLIGEGGVGVWKDTTYGTNLDPTAKPYTPPPGPEPDLMPTRDPPDRSKPKRHPSLSQLFTRWQFRP